VPVDVFAHDDDVGRDLAAVDWSATALGVPERWPLSLRTALDILLASRFPMWMAWGEDLVFFCNAAYRRDTLGRKYPWALGRPASEVWAEIWEEIGPRIETVLSTGKATWDEALLLFLERSGFPEETYHTFSYSPLRDDGGAVVGMLCVVNEETERIVAERRMETLRDLGSDPTAVRTEAEMLAFTARQLERNLKTFPFTLTYLFDEGVARLAGSSGIAEGHPAAPTVLAVDDPEALWPAGAAAKGESALVELAGLVPAELPTGFWPGPPTQVAVQPLPRQGGSPYGFLVAALNRYRPFDEGYRGFIELTARHIAAGVASARDYQAQQRRAEELAALDRAKTAFFSNVSHEFRTPLTLILGTLEELRTRLAGADELTREELEVARRNGLRLGKLVNALLDFSRIEAGRMQAGFAPEDLAALTAELASVFRSAVERAGLVFDVDCPPLPEPVYVDRNLWEQVILNLLSNALKFTFAGTIRVAVRGEPDGACVTVSDTGIGVREAEMPRLFERFHRIENVAARSNEGSGIGLALVKELVGLHGGVITAESAEGRGTAFTIRLPYGAAHLPPEARVAAAQSAAELDTAAADSFVQEALRWLPCDQDAGDARDLSAVGSPWSSAARMRTAEPSHLLVADDNADMREYLARLLRGAGYLVSVVRDGVEALESVRAAPPDLVVSDVMMPRMGGLQLVEALRREPRTASVPVLLLSARAGQEASIEGLEAGADDYLVKPFSAAELLARVRANVELARMRSHHARWRNALVDSMQDAFFVADEQGAIVEVNAAFAEILGYGPEGLPYRTPHPWWPDAAADPRAYDAAREAAERQATERRGSYVVQAAHRDGRRVWIRSTFDAVRDPETGQRVKVGTFRDVTAEHDAGRRDTALAALSLRLSRATDLEQALTGALVQLRALWDAERTLAVLFPDDESEPVLGSTDPGLRWAELSERRRAALAAHADGPVLVAVMGPGERGGAGIALKHPAGTLVLWLDLDPRRPFTEQDCTLLSMLAGHLSSGLHRAHQIDQQRETALALQRAILGPSVLPPGFAVRYEPAARPLEVGGDWYDTVPLPDGRIGVVVGDCVGRGLEAATVMGQLRSACRALLLRDARPDRVLSALDHFAATIPDALCTTVFCGVLDAQTGELTYSSAGHPPGILARPDGRTELLGRATSLPLAVRPGVDRPYAVEKVPGRATLLLYTDGLVERRRRPLNVGIELAGAALCEERDAGVEELAERMMARLAPAGGYDDDVAVLLYRHPGPFETEFPATPGLLAPVRSSLRDWLECCALPAPTIQKVLVAAGEACTNAVEHAHVALPEGVGSVRMRAEAYAGHISLTVTDAGRWREPRSRRDSHRGRGTAIMRGLIPEVAVETGSAGTTVTFQIGIDP
jgi:PAS domain S-box-containing protein